MTVIDLGAIKGTRPLPFLILADPQQEYVCSNRPLGLADAAPAIENCKRLLAYCRSARVPVAFLRWSQPNALFNPRGRFSGWIEGLEPIASDMVFERAWPSAYASREFLDFMDSGASAHAAIAGFTGSMACLATIIEGARRLHHFTFIYDASHSSALPGRTESETHAVVSDLISIYAPVMSTAEWIRTLALEEVKPHHATRKLPHTRDEIEAGDDRNP